jgi:methionine synthase II (cobalamin-independent)
VEGLAGLPDGKILIPGVVSHATNVVEHPEPVADRILTFAKVVPGPSSKRWWPA